MPSYYNHKNWENRGSVKIVPRSFWRKLPALKRIIPYHVGDRVEFDIFTDKPNDDKDVRVYRHIIYEQLSDREKEYFCDINEKHTRVIGNMIPREGDITYSLGNSSNMLPETIIFTARVISWDTVISNWFWVIAAALLGGFFSLFIAIFTGLVKINPRWELWYRP